MKALTVQQPWAWAIFHGKDVENRTQLFKHRGPLAIHAGARISNRGQASPLVREAWSSAGLLTKVIRDEAKETWETDYFVEGPPNDALALGAVLGVVDLVDTHYEEAGCCAPWGEKLYVEHGGKVRKQIVHLCLENPVEFHEPIENIKGKLGVWTPDHDLTYAINHAKMVAA
jgi:hypothetical protein